MSWALRIAFANLILTTGAALADDAKVCLDSTAVGNMAKEYKIRCQQNIAELSRFLRVNDVRISETGESAYNSTLVACDFSNDPLLQNLGDFETIAKADAAIAKLGVDGYVSLTKESLLEIKQKYKISYMENMAETEKSLENDYLRTLAAFAKARARHEATISVVETCR